MRCITSEYLFGFLLYLLEEGSILDERKKIMVKRFCENVLALD